jgi:hypothetical protein
VLTRLPTQRSSMTGELLPHRWQPPSAAACRRRLIRQPRLQCRGQ